MDDQHGVRERARRGKAPPTNLPVIRDKLIGRERELASARHLLLRADVGLLTLTGPGGSGKTRLALDLAWSVLDQFDHGASFVGLAPIRDSRLVASTIAQALGVRETGSRPLVESLKEALRDKHVLLVLDNFEQLLPAASLVAEVLASCSYLKVLATSRAALQVRGEYELPVPPLALPDAEARPSPETLSRYAATALFVERATAIRPDFAITDEVAAAVAEIARRVDGLPLAIELAAARCRVLSPMALLARLERRLTVLAHGPRDLPARQQALRDTIGWSYDLLDVAERRLFRRLAVFVGGCTLEATEAICDPAGRLGIDVLDGVASLVTKSLLTRDEQGGEPRFGMLETIREYGLEQLEVSGETADLRRRHAEYYLTLAERAEPELRGPEQREWLARLETEHDNLRAALAWSQAEPGGAEAGLRLASALGWFWQVRGYLTEARRWLELGLARASGAGPSVRAKALAWAGSLAFRQGDLGLARERAEVAIALHRDSADQRTLFLASKVLAQVSTVRGEYEAARARFEQNLKIARESGDTGLIADALYCLGVLGTYTGEYAAARGSLEQALALDRELGDRTHCSRVLGMLGRVVARQRDYATARALQEESLSLKRADGDRRSAAESLRELGDIALEQGCYAEARSRYRESLAGLWAAGDREILALALESCAHLAVAGGDAERAARLLGAAEALRLAIGAALPQAHHLRHERTSAAVHAALDEETFNACWTDGSTMTVQQAIDDALCAEEPAQVQPPPTPPSAAGRTDSLTRREREVAVLVGRGYTNRRIAEELVITERTAEVHARNIREKLGLATRAQIAAWAAQQGLLSADA